METARIALNQTAVMFLLAAVGWCLFKTGKITQKGSKELAGILLYVILPCVIIKAFCTEYTPEKCSHLLWSFVLSVVCLFISMIIAQVFFHKRPIDNFGAAFSNAGFMGIPLIKALLGDEAVIFAAPFIALLNIFQWTYGVVVMTGKKDSIQPKKLLTNPILISLLAGLICFFGRLSLPTVIDVTLAHISGMNAPAAMIILGVYLAQTDIKSLFTDKMLYWNSIVRLMVIPVVTLFLLAVLPSSMGMAKMALLAVASAPVGSNVAVYAQVNGLDYTYACKTVCLSTIFSIVSMPFILLLANGIWH